MQQKPNMIYTPNRHIPIGEATANCYTSSFISKFGCKEYFDHNKDLLFFERNQEITMQIEKLEL